MDKRRDDISGKARRLVLGIGCASGTPADELIRLAETVLAASHLDPVALSGIATIDIRCNERGLLGLAAHFGVPLHGHPAATLEALTPRLETPSETVYRLVGCHGVAEAAALASAGEGAQLVVAKLRSGHATASLALNFVHPDQVLGPIASQPDSAASSFESSRAGLLT